MSTLTMWLLRVSGLSALRFLSNQIKSKPAAATRRHVWKGAARHTCFCI